MRIVHWLRPMVLLAGLAGSQSTTWADTAVWPMVLEDEGETVVLQQPRMTGWENFRTLSGQIPFELRTTPGQPPVRGSTGFEAETVVHFEDRTIRLHELRLSAARLDAGTADPALHRRLSDAVAGRFKSMDMDALVRGLPADFQVPEQASPPHQLNFQPPRIVVSKRPARLMLIDGPPALAPVSGTGIEFVVNTDWSVFRHETSGRWFILDSGRWLMNSMLSSGSWLNTVDLPEDFLTLQVSSDWPEVAAAMPPVKVTEQPHRIIISYEPAELVLIDGEMVLEAVGSGGLEYVSNTGRDLFRWSGRWYLLAAGRWFHTKNVDRKWYAVKELPAVFANIPEDHPRGRVLAAVPGTPAARLARIEASIPRTARISLADASELEIPYAGEPSFVEIQGTGLRRAENTPFQVIQHNNFFYLCHEGAWYSSGGPAGPWQPAHEVPEAIYTIPPTDPAFNVTFVRLDSFDDSSGQAAYKSTGGYYSRYWTGSSMVYGTGWYYPGYYNRSVYWRYPPTYGYGWGGWGPYYPAYPRYYSTTLEVDRSAKDWQWDLSGNKRAVYDYGPRNTIGSGTYVMPDSDNHKAGGKQ
jgi:hypothetical protein